MNVKPGLFAALAAAALCGGCFKDVSYDTDYVLKPLVQERSGDAVVATPGALAYAFAADTVLWEVASYEDALAGVLTRKDDASQQLAPYVAAEPFAEGGADGEETGTEGWLRMRLDRASQAVLVVDPATRIYGLTQQAIPENLPRLYVSVVFKPWKEANYFRDGAWDFYNPFYEPPVYLDCYLVPSVQQTEGGALEPALDLKVYAFAADTTAWRIASYEDALSHTITSKEDPAKTRSQIDFEGFREQSTGRYGLKVSSTPIFLVAVDTAHERYAYSQQDLTLGGEAVEFPLVFRLWQQQYLTVEAGGWRVVDPAKAPQAAPEPEPEPGPAAQSASATPAASASASQPAAQSASGFGPQNRHASSDRPR